jgi:heat shock protein HspQ
MFARQRREGKRKMTLGRQSFQKFFHLAGCVVKIEPDYALASAWIFI